MIIKEILKDNDFTNKFEFFKDFKESPYYDKLLDLYDNLDTKALFKSKIHGQAHIERVMLYSMLLSFKYNLDDIDTKIIGTCSSYHDVKRVDDSYDEGHGKRASEVISNFTNLDGDNLQITKAILTSHSIDDKLMKKVIDNYNIKDKKRALFLAKLFKDSDNLDRVRLNDLDEKFLRLDFSKELVNFARKLFERYKDYAI
ncbi:MAG: hypothetical protein Q4B36_07050 [Tissierellia bacterium]|nr:hypothetical protein [Tissierellia bacterium]